MNAREMLFQALAEETGAHAHGVSVFYDLGAGYLVLISDQPLPPQARHLTRAEALQALADLGIH